MIVCKHSSLLPIIHVCFTYSYVMCCLLHVLGEMALLRLFCCTAINMINFIQNYHSLLQVSQRFFQRHVHSSD